MATINNENRINGMLTLPEMDNTIVIPSSDIHVVDATGNLNDIIDINTVGEPKKREVNYSIPTWNDVLHNIPKTPSYRKEGRVSINHFGTQEISSLGNASPEEVMHAIGADFHAVQEYNDRVNPVTGEVEKIKNPILINDKTGKEICQSTPTYKVIDYDEAIYCFFSLLNEIKKHG